MKQLLHVWLILLLITGSCRKESPENRPDTAIKPFYAPSTVLEKPEAEPTYHEDTATQYKYRLGHSGDYTYNYDVSGQNKSGDTVSGNITIKNKYGNGKLTNQKGDTFKVTVEWIGYGKLLAKDEKNNEYILHTE